MTWAKISCGLLFRVSQALHSEARPSGVGHDIARVSGPGTLDADAHQDIGTRHVELGSGLRTYQANESQSATQARFPVLLGKTS
jgi:hypothetical protein